MKEVIVCHSFPAWDTPYIKSTIELLKELSAHYRVIMIDYHYTIKDVFFNEYAPKKSMIKPNQRVRIMETSQGAIEVISTPPILPVNWIKNEKLFDNMVKLDAKIIGSTVVRTLEKLGVKDYTLINAFNPVYGLHLKKYLKPKKTIYYCYDEISATEWSGEHGGAYEEKFIRQVDAVICTSKKLQKDRIHLNSNTHFVPNGVNLDIFKSNDVANYSKNILGYVGAIDSRIDFDLLKKIAETFSDHQIEMYGPIKTDLPELPINIQFKGALDQTELPEKIKNFKVCMIPFVKNKLTEAIYPLKINEYLAMGKAVVSTNFSDLSDFEAMAQVANSHMEFISQIRGADESDESTESRKEFASKNSWKARAEEFANYF